MILNAADLKIETINPGYKELLGGRDVLDFPISEIFTGQDVDQLIKLLKKVGRDGQAFTTPPMKAHLADDSDTVATRFIHTIVPITDLTTSKVNRLFIYSERVQ